MIIKEMLPSVSQGSPDSQPTICVDAKHQASQTADSLLLFGLVSIQKVTVSKIRSPCGNDYRGI